MYCHRCAAKQAIDAGVYAGVPFEELPCSKCHLEHSAEGTMSFDAGREDKKAREGLGIPEAPPAAMMPVTVLEEAVKLFLGLSTEEFALVRDRYAGKQYAQIAAERRVTPQAVEIRLRRVLQRIPLIQYLFPTKTKKRQARQRLKAASARA